MSMIANLPEAIRQELLACVTPHAFDAAKWSAIVAQHKLTPIGRDLIQEAYNEVIGQVLAQEDRHRAELAGR
jgi:hypothetical protein